MCVLYGIINATGINSYIIYSENMTKADKKLPERKEYMDQLAISLAKPWAIKRLANSNLSRKVKYNIVNVFDLPTQPMSLQR